MALQHLRSSTANKRPLPAGMSDGQLAINTNLASPGLFLKNSNGDLVKVGPVHVGTTAPNVSPAAGGETGNTTGELWLDTSLTPNELKTWNGSAWVSATGQEIPVSKLIDGSARQLLQTDAAGTGVEWTSNVDVPGTLDVTGAATFDSSVAVTGTLTKSGSNVVTVGDTGTVTSTMIVDGTIVDADVNASAAIAGTKVSPNFGSQTVQTTGIVSHALGTAGSPTLTFTGDTNTGIYSPGADQVAVATNGTGRLFVNASGDTLLQDSKFLTWGNGNQGLFGENASSNLRFYTSGAERIRLDSSGRVGIGTSSPASLVHIAGGGTGRRGALRFSDAGGANYWEIGRDNGVNGSFTFTQNGTERLCIDYLAGNVGIGTSSPNTALDVVGTIKSSTTVSAGSDFRISNNSFSRVAHSNGVGGFVGGYNVKWSSGVKHDSTGNVSAIYYDSNGFLRFYTNSSQAADTAAQERLTITPAGAVGIGTTPDSPLHVVGTGGTGLRIGYTNNTNYFDANTQIFRSNNATTTYGQWDSSGRLLVGTSSSTNAAASCKLLTNGNSTEIRLTNTYGNPKLELVRQEALAGGGGIGSIEWKAYDSGTTERVAASISGQTDGNWASGDCPSLLLFSTTANGASSPTPRMTIDSSGRIGINGAYDLGAANRISIDPTEGTIGFGMDGREEYVTGEAGCYIYSGSGSTGTTLAGELVLQSRSNTGRSITFVTGSTPTKRMEIAGNGNVSVVGALSKGSGSFKISHPLPEKTDTHYLYHSFIEGPQADLIYRGHVQLVNGTASVNIDEAARMTEGTFEALCTNVCCFTSNESDWTAVRGSVSGNILTIEAQDQTSTADVYWMVVGERKDQHMLDTNWTDENGRVITERLKSEVDAPAEE